VAAGRLELEALARGRGVDGAADGGRRVRLARRPGGRDLRVREAPGEVLHPEAARGGTP
jgi:hypothetical protein